VGRVEIYYYFLTILRGSVENNLVNREEANYIYIIGCRINKKNLIWWAGGHPWPVGCFGSWVLSFI
jgi:hypothetical protein